MYNIPEDMLNAFQSTPAVLQALLTTRRQRNSEGWGPVEIVCHFRDAEERALERMRQMRDQDNPSITGYDPEVWVKERNYAGSNIQEALEAFTRFREQHIAELRALTAQGWQRGGQHSEHGLFDILNHTEHMVAHDLSHLGQLANLPIAGEQEAWFGS